jgi:hypothetical protein
MLLSTKRLTTACQYICGAGVSSTTTIVDLPQVLKIQVEYIENMPDGTLVKTRCDTARIPETLDVSPFMKEEPTGAQSFCSLISITPI